MNFEETTANLHKMIPLKDETFEGDTVVICAETDGGDHQLMFAHIDNIVSDIKKDWWVVDMSIIGLPLKKSRIKLRTPQMQGEIFTLGGLKTFMAAINFELLEKDDTPKKEKPKTKSHLKVIK